MQNEFYSKAFRYEFKRRSVRSRGFVIDGAEFGEQRTAGGESVAWRNLEPAVAPIASPNRYVTMCTINYHTLSVINNNSMIRGFIIIIIIIMLSKLSFFERNAETKVKMKQQFLFKVIQICNFNQLFKKFFFILSPTFIFLFNNIE